MKRDFNFVWGEEKDELKKNNTELWVLPRKEEFYACYWHPYFCVNSHLELLKV